MVRIIDRTGQLPLPAEIELDGWATSLPQSDYDETTILKLDRGHALWERFHSEFKTDLDLERLPSGRFDTNDLVMVFSVLAYTYNILRWMRLRGLMGQARADPPSGQAPALAHGDAGTDLSRRSLGAQRAAIDAALQPPLSRLPSHSSASRQISLSINASRMRKVQQARMNCAC